MIKTKQTLTALVVLGFLHAAPAAAQTAGSTEPTLGDKVEVGVEATIDGAVKVWDGTKYVSKKAWEGTKKGAATAVEKSGEAWEATKTGTAKVWDKTKEISGDVVDAVKTPDSTETAPVEEKSINVSD